MQSKIQLVINGTQVMIPIELTDDQVHQLMVAAGVDGDLTGWDEPRIGQKGYYEDKFNQVAEFDITEDTIDFARDLYENDNFFSTYEVAKNTIRADNVCRRLRHYAINHRAPELSMADGGYTITYNYDTSSLEIGATGSWLGIGDVVFDTEDIARQAMRKYATELAWYFTEGKTSM